MLKHRPRALTARFKNTVSGTNEHWLSLVIDYDNCITLCMDKSSIRQRQYQWAKQARLAAHTDYKLRARFALYDSRNSDKKRGLENNLDLEFVQSLFEGGCSYCGGFEKMSMDRIDNAIGHVRTNVVASCWRCNYFRRDMPWDAWLIIVPVLKQIVEAGLLDNWSAGGKLGYVGGDDIVFEKRKCGVCKVCGSTDVVPQRRFCRTHLLQHQREYMQNRKSKHLLN